MTKDEVERAHIVVMESGACIRVYAGEGACDDTFAGEMLDAPEHMTRLGAEVSCYWSCSKAVSVSAPTPTSETDQLGGVGV